MDRRDREQPARKTPVGFGRIRAWLSWRSHDRQPTLPLSSAPPQPAAACGFADRNRSRFTNVYAVIATLIIWLGLGTTLPAQDRPSDTLTLANLEDQFEVLSKQLSPSVVAISATSNAIASPDLSRTEQLSADRLNTSVFGKASRIVGTGFVIAADGYLLTNDHVITNAQQLWVTTDDRKVFPAIVVASDPRLDLAVLKIPTSNLQPVKWAADDARRGQWAIALGNP